jgi:GNAT superfamily N-acetyltransferase
MAMMIFGFSIVIGIDATKVQKGMENQLRFSVFLLPYMNNKINIRPARPEETGLVLEFIKKLAVYEKCADEVVADEATLHHSLFVEHSAEVVFAEEDGVAIGFALFFHNFSTFVGRKGLYLEDLFIIPEKRGRGYGKALLKYLARTAVERNCGRMEWICLDWNQPALNVYRSIGAVPMDEWTVQRLSETALKQFADSEIN